jgi:hypothetical protein
MSSASYYCCCFPVQEWGIGSMIESCMASPPEADLAPVGDQVEKAKGRTSTRLGSLRSAMDSFQHFPQSKRRLSQILQVKTGVLVYPKCFRMEQDWDDSRKHLAAQDNAENWHIRRPSSFKNAKPGFLCLFSLCFQTPIAYFLCSRRPQNIH